MKKLSLCKKADDSIQNLVLSCLENLRKYSLTDSLTCYQDEYYLFLGVLKTLKSIFYLSENQYNLLFTVSSSGFINKSIWNSLDIDYRLFDEV